MVQIGADASGLELRMLGHYLAFFDGGRFADIVVNGDIHQINADATSKALEIEISPSEIKTLTYAFLYGAGDAKLGSTVAKALMRQIVSVPGDFDEHDLKVLDKRFYPDYGKRARVAFVQAIPGLGPLLDAVAKKADGDILKGLDGRPIRLQGKKHAALNYLLQSAGAIVCKKWLVDSYGGLERSGLIPGVNYQPLGFIHDEIQLACTPIIAEVVKTVLTSTMPNVGKHFELKVPLAAEAKEGESWADCH
jgi:DNA polymerase I-like protein with 3'-5' exonuclease and polymerase domains